jgi:eukaryotic-like serine/threonine-protein kinase
MLELKASRFFQAALQSGLIDEAGLAACFEVIPPEKRTPDGIDRRLARQAIATGRLTLWQAQQVLGGRATGFKIDKYVLLDLLGRGGMGRVYLARDVRLDRMVALKILSQERMNNPRAIARFQREAKVGAQLQHENLVRVYDEGESGGVRYLVMEYIEGKNVGQLIGELGAIPWPTAARIGRQIALGLEHARLKELIHRDVNPCNILITKDGTAKLTDLGLAIDLNDADNVTRDGATVGTFDYVSPEQARHSRSVDTRTDIYSLGCSLYHMIAGRVPFPVASLPEKLYAHQLHDPDPLAEVAPGTPEGLVEAIRKMMRKQPDDRHQTPLEVAQALEPFAIESGWTTTQAVSGSASASARPPGPSPSPTSVTATSAASPSPGPDLVARPTDAPASARAGAVAVAEAPSSWVANLDLGPGPGPGSKPSASGSGSKTSGSGQGAAAGDSFFPVDLGRDEPLLAGLNPSPKPKSRIKAAPKPKPEPEAKPEGESTGPRFRLPTLSKRVAQVAIGAGAAVVALAVVATLATLALSGPGFVKAKSGGDPSASKPKVAKKLARGDVVVLFRDGESEPAKSLAEALALASNHSGAEVILGGAATVRVDNGKTIRVPDGGLTLRSADGARPTLEVKVKGPQPMFLVNANLRLEGLTVVVRYETASGAPIFQVERDLTLTRCTFRADGPPEGSQFALAEGRKTTVDGCLFEGFETALHVEANPSTTVSLKRSIFLSARPGEEAIGRAVRFRSIYGQGAACRLSVENCSVRAATFLEAGNFSTATPLEVGVSASAFLVKSLLAFDGEMKPPLGPGAALRWKGTSNRYKVAGPAWATFPGAPADLDTWSKLTGEADAKAQDLKLAKEPPDPTTPKDCALLDEDGKPVGADPSKVGPD